MSSILKYKLTEGDFLDFQTHSSARSKHQQSQRLKARIVTCLVVGIVGYYYFTRGADSLAHAHFALAALLFVFYHRYSFWKYKRHFIKHIREHRKGMIGIEFSLEIVDGQILSTSEAGDGTLKPSAIEELVELENIYLIAFKQSQSVILPKREVLSGDPKSIVEELSRITSLPIINRRKLQWK